MKDLNSIHSELSAIGDLIARYERTISKAKSHLVPPAQQKRLECQRRDQEMKKQRLERGCRDSRFLVKKEVDSVRLGDDKHKGSHQGMKKQQVEESRDARLSVQKEDGVTLETKCLRDNTHEGREATLVLDSIRLGDDEHKRSDQGMKKQQVEASRDARLSVQKEDGVTLETKCLHDNKHQGREATVVLGSIRLGGDENKGSDQGMRNQQLEGGRDARPSVHTEDEVTLEPKCLRDSKHKGREATLVSTSRSERIEAQRRLQKYRRETRQRLEQKRLEAQRKEQEQKEKQQPEQHRPLESTITEDQLLAKIEEKVPEQQLLAAREVNLEPVSLGDDNHIGSDQEMKQQLLVERHGARPSVHTEDEVKLEPKCLPDDKHKGREATLVSTSRSERVEAQRRFQKYRLETRKRLEQERLEAQRKEQEQNENEKQQLEQQSTLEYTIIEDQSLAEIEEKVLKRQRLAARRREERSQVLDQLEERLRRSEENKQIMAELLAEQVSIREEEQRVRKERRLLEEQRAKQDEKGKERLGEGGLEQERLGQERLEKQRLEQERLKEERLEKQLLEQERLEQEKQQLEQERLERERLEQQERLKEKQEQERKERFYKTKIYHEQIAELNRQIAKAEAKRIAERQSGIDRSSRHVDASESSEDFYSEDDDFEDTEATEEETESEYEEVTVAEESEDEYDEVTVEEDLFEADGEEPLGSECKVHSCPASIACPHGSNDSKLSELEWSTISYESLEQPIAYAYPAPAPVAVVPTDNRIEKEEKNDQTEQERTGYSPRTYNDIHIPSPDSVLSAVRRNQELAVNTSPDIDDSSIINPLLNPADLHPGYIDKVAPTVHIVRSKGNLARTHQDYSVPPLCWVVVDINQRRASKIVMHLHGMGTDQVVDEFADLCGMGMVRDISSGLTRVRDLLQPNFFITMRSAMGWDTKPDTYDDVLSALQSTNECSVVLIRHSHLCPVKKNKA